MRDSMNCKPISFLCKLAIFSALASTFFWNCARELTPTGGPKDTLAPQITKMKPLNYSKNFSGKRVAIHFDEYVSLEAITENLIVSPPVETKPEVRQKGKKIIINFSNCEFKDSTTYSLDFGESIKDLNEGNVFRNFAYIFSTGNSIDSLRIQGRIRDALTNEVPKPVFVLLYSNLTDSAPATELPDYVARTNNKGKFIFQTLREGAYRVIATDDINRNYMNDQPEEQVAFFDSIISPTAENTIIVDTISITDTIVAFEHENGLSHTDTLYIDSLVKRSETVFKPNPIELFLFQPETNIQYIKEYSRKRKERVDFVFNQSLFTDTVDIRFRDSLFARTKMSYNISPEKDSLTVWMHDSITIATDTVTFLVSYNRYDTTGTMYLHTDTILPRYDKRKDKFKGLQLLRFAFSIRQNDRILPTAHIQFESSIPFTDIDTSALRLYSTIDTVGMKMRNEEFYATDTAMQEIIQELIYPVYEDYVPDSAYTEQKIVTHRYAPNRFMLRFAFPIDPKGISINLTQKPKLQSWYRSEFDKSRNALYCWITDSSALLYASPEISVTFKNIDGSIAEKTILLKKGKKSKKRKSIKNGKFDLYVAEEQQKNLFLNETVDVMFANPLRDVDTSLITLTETKDTSQTNLPALYEIDPTTGRTLHIHYQWEKGKTYLLNLEKKATTDIYGLSNKDYITSIKCQTPQRHKILTRESRTVSPDTLYPEKYTAEAAWDIEKKYRFVIGENAVTDIYGTKNDSTAIDFSIINPENFGNLEIRLHNCKTPTILHLQSGDRKNTIRTLHSADTGTVSFTFPNLAPTKYTLKAVEDANGNKKWDTGNYYKGLQPEKVRFGAEQIEIKGGRDHVYDWDLSTNDEAERKRIQMENLEKMKRRKGDKQ